MHAQAPELIVEIDRTQIYEGESFIYRVTLNHVENPQEPDLSGFEEFEVALLGQQSLDSRQVSIINGRRSEVIRRGRQYTYRLTPRGSGDQTIPAPTAGVDGETLTGRPVEVRVVPPDDQDTVILQQTVDRTAVYPLQPFTVTLVIAVKELPEQVRERDPLTVQPQPPVLIVPWFDDNQLPDWLQPQRSWTQILEPLISRRGYGFQVNNIGSASAFSLFENRATGFHPTPQRTERMTDDGSMAGYWEYRFERTLIAERTGICQLGPVSLKGTFADRIEGERLNGTDYYAIAPGVSVTVKEVPVEGRPDSFIGAVGTFEAEAALVPSVARVGDPMTLTLRLTGEGTLSDARPPEIDQMANVADNFRTYEATEESDGRTRTFTYSLRPLRKDVMEFPSVPISYFDVTSEQYVTLNTSAIPITVTEAETLSGADIVVAESAGGSGTANRLKANEGGVFANISDLSALRDDRVRPARWLAAWGVIILTWAALSFGIGHVRQLRADPALLRRRSAPAAAASALANAESQLQAGDATAACDSIRRAVAEITASWADVPADGLTAREAAEHLGRLGVEPALIGQVEQLLHECDAARYGASGSDASQMIQRAGELVEQLTRMLRRSRSVVA